MMKFIVNNVKNGCRHGYLQDFKRCSGVKDLVVETPMCLMYTRGGSVPHLTGDVLKKVDNIPKMTQLPLNLLAEHKGAIGMVAGGLGGFCSLDEGSVLYCPIHDTTTAVPSGYNGNIGVGIWGRGGKIMLDIDTFLQVQEALRVDFYQAMSDNDVDERSGKKRLKKSHDRTINFLDRTLERHQKSEKLKDTEIFGTVVGGFSEEDRIFSAKETAERPVAGFVLDGFHRYGPESENFDVQHHRDLIKVTTDNLPKDKPRIMHGLWSPDMVLSGVECGIDIFDSSYTYIVTERGSALVFDYDFQKYDKEKSLPAENGNSDTCTRPFEINLKEKKYFDDFSPLLEGCTCYTCRNHTKSYVSHLLNTTELLAGVLLQIHNFHQYFHFFSSLRESLREDKFDDLKALIQQQKR
ncbi:queuine tRNA-ribosyltransferase accessory subunit 2-like [Lineus longissimus]|uniref:queuine tRNA-ribosyltransferase accessory subunit 2-like n=1 Tax=Lineus longissimus TaxID=88925 RepID=UPI002B4F46BD